MYYIRGYVHICVYIHENIYKTENRMEVYLLNILIDINLCWLDLYLFPFNKRLYSEQKSLFYFFVQQSRALVSFSRIKFRLCALLRLPSLTVFFAILYCFQFITHADLTLSCYDSCIFGKYKSLCSQLLRVLQSKMHTAFHSHLSEFSFSQAFTQNVLDSS